MRVFVVEFVTGGGMADEALPPSLAREGAMMRDALLRDLADLPGLEIVTTHDVRLPPPACGSVPVCVGQDPWRIWRGLAESADVCWPIAPETGGALRRLAGLMRDGGGTLVGPDEETIRITSSKLLTAERLIAAGVPTRQVWQRGDVPVEAAGPFVMKPDDGAGCAETTLLECAPPDCAHPEGFVLQSYVPGEAASLTVLRSSGRTRLLAANRQHVTPRDGAFSFQGVSVGAIDDHSRELARLAEAVSDALPGLAGLFGIDFVLGTQGPVVIEINPRLTTAYAGLREAIGINAALLVEPFATEPSTIRIDRRSVEVAL